MKNTRFCSAGLSYIPSKGAKDPELKAWIDKTLPTLRSHLSAAAKLPPNAGKGKG